MVSITAFSVADLFTVLYACVTLKKLLVVFMTQVFSRLKCFCESIHKGGIRRTDFVPVLVP